MFAASVRTAATTEYPPPMGAVAAMDELIDRILGSGLLSAEVLARADLDPSAPAAEVARQLVRERLLTPYQARSLLAGEERAFFVTERYKILEHLGRGGMGEVYMVEHLLLRRVVAMKLMTAQDTGSGGAGAVERFFREARAVAALDHPNVVRVFDMDRTAFGPLLVMEYVDGSNLHAVVGRGGPLAVGRAVDAVRQAAAGLGHAHAVGLVHRDVKPGNLLLDRMGTVKVVDLGLARYRDAAQNAGLTGMYDSNRVIGTADFQAPEQGLDSGNADARSDVYGLGAALYYLLTGRVPFPEGTITNKLLAHQMKPVPNPAEVNPQVPADLAAVVVRMMAKRPADRPQTMAAVRAVLADWQPGELDPPPPAEMPKHPPTAYRLGLCPPPEGASASAWLAGVGVGSGTDTSPSLRVAPVSQRMAKPNLSTAPRGPATMRMPKPALPPPPPQPVVVPDEEDAPVQLAGPPPHKPMSRRGLFIGLGGGLAVAAAGGVAWWLSNPPATPRMTVPPVPPVPPAASGVVVQGSGSTFVRPAVLAWAAEYAARTGTEVVYSGGGSGKGIDNVLDGHHTFGCTDDPVGEAKLAEHKLKPADLLHVPLALGAVVPMYELPGLKKPLQFTGPILASIFLGEVTTWGDERLSVLSTEPLPDLPIKLVYREPDSGTTAVWTDYLSRASDEFKARVGRSKSPNWPVKGATAGKDGREKGSLGVAQAVKGDRGSLGYVELTYALQESGSYGHVRNKRGNAVKPSEVSVTAAAKNGLATFPDDLRFSLVDVDGDDSYPVAACTWAVLLRRQRRKTGEPAVRFLRWVLTDGQALLPSLKYAPLPDALAAKALDKLNAVEFTD